MSDRHHLIGVRNRDQELCIIDSTGGDDAYEFLKTQRSVAFHRFSELEIISDEALVARYGQDHEIVRSSRLDTVPSGLCHETPGT